MWRNFVRALAFLLVGEGTVTAAPLRVVQCTQGEQCPEDRGGEASSRTSEHESLYWRGVEAVLANLSCEVLPNPRFRLAYQAEREITIRCESRRPLRLPRARDLAMRNRLLMKKQVDYVLEFRRGDALKIAGGIKVKFSVAYWGKTVRQGLEPEPEAIAAYEVAQVDGDVEVRAFSTLAL